MYTYTQNVNYSTYADIYIYIYKYRYVWRYLLGDRMRAISGVSYSGIPTIFVIASCSPQTPTGFETCCCE